ncbi:MAG: zf-HC2 domain-containing protein [Bacteroidota bacterium]
MKDLFTTSTPHLSPETIRDYLGGKLSLEERFAVENHLLDCEICAAAVEGFRAFPQEIEPAPIEALAKRFPPAPVATPVRSLHPTPSRRNWLAVAAAVLLLPLAAWWYWQAQAPERLFRQFYQSYQSDYLALRGGDEAIDPLLKAGIEQYQRGQYAESLTLLESYLNEFPERGSAAFHAGLASLEMGAPRRAIGHLERVRLNEPQYYEDATWYLILAHLRLEEEDEARALLRDLLRLEAGYYETPARELLEALR